MLFLRRGGSLMSTKKPTNQCAICGHSKARVEHKLVTKYEELEKLHKEMSVEGISETRSKELDNQISIVEDQIQALEEKKRINVIKVTAPMIKTAKKSRAILEAEFLEAIKNAQGDEVEELKTEMTDALKTQDMYIQYLQSMYASSGICEECVETIAKTAGIKLQSTEIAVAEQPKTAKLTMESVPTPRNLRLYLDQYVIGQVSAKAYISGAVALHYRRAADLIAGNRKKFNKANLLLIGPTGVGKTEILRTLRECLSEHLGQIPMTTKSATKITSAGYVGEDAESIIDSLFQQALKSVNPKGEKPTNKIIADAVQLTQLGIAHIDEIDKIASKGNTAGVDPSHKGAQDALLTMMEGDIVTLKLPSGVPGQVIPVDIDTKTILFIGSGAFMGVTSDSKSIYELSRERQQNATGENQDSNQAGFLGNLTSKIGNDSLDNYVGGKIDDINPEDVVAYGLGHEFVGRLTNIVTLSRLSIHALARIVVEPKNAILPEYISDMLQFYNIHIMLSQDSVKIKDANEHPNTATVLQAIAQKADDRKTGARAIQSVINGVMFLVTNFPERLSGKYVMLTEESISDPMKLKVFDNPQSEEFTYIEEVLAPTLAKIGEKEDQDNGVENKKPTEEPESSKEVTTDNE